MSREPECRVVSCHNPNGWSQNRRRKGEADAAVGVVATSQLPATEGTMNRNVGQRPAAEEASAAWASAGVRPTRRRGPRERLGST